MFIFSNPLKLLLKAELTKKETHLDEKCFEHHHNPRQKPEPATDHPIRINSSSLMVTYSQCLYFKHEHPIDRLMPPFQMLLNMQCSWLFVIGVIYLLKSQQIDLVNLVI